VATLQALPEEHITRECLSMGPESDAPGSDAPFLSAARLTLNTRGDAVEISTDAPVFSPTLALVLRVQCPGAFFYARHFTMLIPPAPKAAQASPQRPPRGFTLRVGAGESVDSLAVSIFPKSRNRNLRRRLVDEVVKLNPQVFPDGKLKPVAPGTALFFPELRGLSERARRPAAGARAVPPARRAAATRQPDTESAPQAATPVKRPVKRQPTEARPGEPVRLRRALELGERPGPEECRALLPLCGAEQVPGAVAPALEEKARGIESGVQELRLKQESMDSQLARLEQSLAALQKVVEAPVRPAPPAPKPEIRTVVTTEPLPWYYWAGFAAIAAACAVGGFAYGRRQAYAGTLSDTDERLDEMLASAATAIRELDDVPTTPPKRVAARPEPTPPKAIPEPPPAHPPVTGTKPLAPRERAEADIKLEPGAATTPGGNVDVELESESAARSVGLSSKVLFEMDQALDNTRSMFTDVDRFIALGRTQNAISLLQFQVHKDPKDRDSWIKLMAIYRQEKMDAELAGAAREFKKHFPGEDAMAD
jgi:hypothetical protein